jgi:hypothetical protein
MKCIKNIKASKSYDLNEIRRTDDLDAEQKVKSGNWKYIPKSEWKSAVRKLVKPEPVPVVEQPVQEETASEKQLKSKKRGKSKE